MKRIKLRECKYCKRQVKLQNCFWLFSDTGRVICNPCSTKPVIPLELKQKGKTPKEIKEFMAKLLT